jgi:hypothetical protein
VLVWDDDDDSTSPAPRGPSARRFAARRRPLCPWWTTVRLPLAILGGTFALVTIVLPLGGHVARRIGPTLLAGGVVVLLPGAIRHWVSPNRRLARDAATAVAALAALDGSLRAVGAPAVTADLRALLVALIVFWGGLACWSALAVWAALRVDRPARDQPSFVPRRPGDPKNGGR